MKASENAMQRLHLILCFSDGAIRVFTKNPERQASSEQLKSYADQVSNFENFENQAIGGVKVSE